MTQLVRGWTKHLTPPIPGWQRTDPLDRGLVAEWRFDPASGLLLPDYSGRGNDMTVSGATWETAGAGMSLGFDGADDSAVLGKAVTTQIDNVTLEMLIYPRSWQTAGGDPNESDGELMLSLGDDSAWDAGYGMGVHHATAEGRFCILHMTIRWVDFNTNLLVNTLYHLVALRDNGTWRGYVNGLAEAATDGNAPQAPDPYTTIACSYDNGGAIWREMDCRVFLARVYERALSPSEVLARYQICLKRGQPLTHVWMMSGGRAPVAPPVGGAMTLWGRYWGP